MKNIDQVLPILRLRGSPRSLTSCQFEKRVFMVKSVILNLTLWVALYSWPFLSVYIYKSETNETSLRCNSNVLVHYNWRSLDLKLNVNIIRAGKGQLSKTMLNGSTGFIIGYLLEAAKETFCLIFSSARQKEVEGRPLWEVSKEESHLFQYFQKIPADQQQIYQKNHQKM